MNKLIINLIHVYQYLFKFKAPCCRFYPSCSSYALLQFKNNNFFRAFFSSVYRILRCNPVSQGGLDYPFIYKDIKIDFFTDIAFMSLDIKKIKYILIEVKKNKYYVRIISRY